MTRRTMTDRDVTVAILMRCCGCGYSEIGRLLEFQAASIKYRLDPDFRAYRKSKAKQHYNPKKDAKRQKRYRQKNPDRFHLRERNRVRNPEERRRANHRYNQSHREQNTRRHRQRIQTDIEYRLRVYLRTRLYNALKRKSRTGSAVSDLGCTIDELRKHLENQFQPGMTWANHGDWHIDHIRPLASFDLTDRTEIQRACHFTNLQPLWAIDNQRKRDANPSLHQSPILTKVG